MTLVKTNSDDDIEDPTASYYEMEAFDSIWQALRWNQIRKRVPVCAKKLIRSRYMLANLVYVGYAIGILILDFDTSLYDSSSSSDGSSLSNDTVTTTLSPSWVDQSASSPVYVDHMFLGFAVLHLVSAFLYLWAWRGRSWFDVILIPDYLNHVEAALYIWSASWYTREDTLGGYYTLAVHKIEMAASTVDLMAAVGWIVAWYLTYTRTLGRGFSLDDPDTIAYLCTLTASIIYFVYNIQINVQPEVYGTNFVYTYADIVYFIGACYYTFAALRDENCFWFLPMAGQYGVAAGRIQIETEKVLPAFGKPPIVLTNLCRRRDTGKATIIRFQSTDTNTIRL